LGRLIRQPPTLKGESPHSCCVQSALLEASPPPNTACETRMTAFLPRHTMNDMKTICIASLALAMLVLGTSLCALGQKDKDDDFGPTSWLNFVVVRDENGKPVRNAAVIMHPVSPKGKQEQGGMELKTDVDGKADYNGVPYGMLRVQVLAQGFQTYGQDYNIDQPKVALTIKMKRPQHQYSIYGSHPADTSSPAKDNPPPDQKKQN